jgi:hypothetical protein
LIVGLFTSKFCVFVESAEIGNWQAWSWSKLCRWS